MIAARARLATLALLLVVLPMVAAAQDAHTPGSAATPLGAKLITGAWSPFTPIADLPRTPPGVPALPTLLTAPAPRIGLAWTAGDPSGLRIDIPDRFSSAVLSSADERGTYRRPLDPAQSTIVQGHIVGWRPLGARGGAVGRIVVDQEGRNPSSAAHVNAPYATTPFVLVDSAETAMRLQRARLEGAAGWVMGAWAVGVGAGIESRDGRSERTRVPRLARTASPALSAGLSRSLPWAALRLSVFGRWNSSAETSQIIPRTGTGTAFLLAGYTEPDRISVAPLSALVRRMDRRAFAYGAGAAGSLFGASLTVAGELTQRDEKYSSQLRDNPPADRWEATGSRIVAAAQRRVMRERVLVTVDVQRTELEGNGTRFDLTGTVFQAVESQLRAAADVRWAARDSVWQLVATGGVQREERQRGDFVARRKVAIDSWTPSGALEIARRIRGPLDLSAAYGIAIYTPTGSIPNAALEGPIYRAFAGPSVAYDVTEATMHRAALTARYRLRGGTSLWTSGSLETREGASSSATTTAAASAPVGDRRAFSLSVGISR